MIGRRKRLDGDDSEGEQPLQDDSSASSASEPLSDNHLSSDEEEAPADVAEIDELLEKKLTMPEQPKTETETQDNQSKAKASQKRKKEKRRRPRRSRRKKRREEAEITGEGQGQDKRTSEDKPEARKSRSRRRRREKRSSSAREAEIHSGSEDKKGFGGRRRRRKLVKQYVPKNQAAQNEGDYRGPRENGRHHEGGRQFRERNQFRGGPSRRGKVRYSHKRHHDLNTDGQRGGYRGYNNRRSREPYYENYGEEYMYPPMPYPMMPMTNQYVPMPYYGAPVAFNAEEIKSKLNVNAKEFTLPPRPEAPMQQGEVKSEDDIHADDGPTSAEQQSSDKV